MRQMRIQLNKKRIQLMSLDYQNQIHQALKHAVQSQFSDDVSGESAKKVSDNVILPMKANPVWKRMRSLDDEPECYTGYYITYPGLNITSPKCSPVALYTACSGSMANHGNKRKCEPSHYEYYPHYNVTIPTKCSCAR